MRVKKEDLIQQIKNENSDLTLAQINRVYHSIFDNIMTTVADGDTVLILGFGRFEPRTLKPRKARNVVTGEPINVPEQKRPRFKAGTTFNQLVNGR